MILLDTLLPQKWHGNCSKVDNKLAVKLNAFIPNISIELKEGGGSNPWITD